MTIRDQEKHKMYFPSLCLENFYFDGLGCLWIAALDVTLPGPLRIVTLCSLTGFLLSEFVSYRGIATNFQSMNGIKTGGQCENKYDLPSISRCKAVVN